jgi:predicted protein tyrosine phosphatase
MTTTTMNFKVLSRGEVERPNAEKDPHIIISISDTVAERADVKDNPNTLDVLFLAFHDIDYAREGFDLFSESQADEILTFFQRYRKEAKTIIAHCNMGQCRSPGVIAALQRIEIGNDSEWFKRKTPNRRVYSLILGRAYDRQIYDPYTK